MTTITGMITKSTCTYMPIGIKCKISLDEKGQVQSAHRIDNGAGTHVMTDYDMRNTKYVLEKNIIEESFECKEDAEKFFEMYN